MFDGHLNKCKKCTKNDAHIHRIKNLEAVKEYDRNRPNCYERAKINGERIKKMRISNPEKYAQYMKKKKNWVLQNPHKRKAQVLSGNRMVRYGLKNDSCEFCGIKDVPLDGHHHDYDKPLDVTWLCKKCHGLEHRKINARNRLEVACQTT